MNNIYQYKSSRLEFKDVDQKKGIVSGWFSAFHSRDSDKDIIRPGAYLKTIQENGPKSAKPRIKHLLNHTPSQPLGVLLDLKEDSHGLYYESQIGTHQLGKDFLAMVESGLITEHSIGYQTMKSNHLKDGGAELLELKLFEGSSLTAWGSNENTPISGLKSLHDAGEVKTRIEQLEKFCRNSSASDETIELLLLEIKQLGQIVSDLNKPTQPVKTTEPEAKGIALLRFRTALETELFNLSN